MYKRGSKRTILFLTLFGLLLFSTIIIATEINNSQNETNNYNTSLLINTTTFNYTENITLLTHSFAQNNSESITIEKNSKKIHKDVLNADEDSNTKVLVQLKNDKDRITNKIKKGTVKESKDSNLLFAELYNDEIQELANDSSVLKIWLDLETQSFLDESVYQINADYLWDVGFTGSNVKIAILDTGIDADHEMLAGRVVSQIDFTGSGSTEDVYGHGTHVAGIIAGEGEYKGVASGVQIYNGKVLDDSGSGSLSWLINGIDWAIENNVDIISLSLGAVYSGSPEEQLGSPEVLKVQEAIDAGIVVVIASGNCGSGNCGSFDLVTSPGIARDAITVGAVNDNNEWAYFSSGSIINDYIKPDLVAPGVGICSSVPSGYACYSGTSMATPHVSGAAALLLEHDDYTPLEIKEILEDNSLDLGDSGKDVKYGSGLLNLENIIQVSNNQPRIDNVDILVSGKKVIITVNTSNSDNVKVEVISSDETKTQIIDEEDFTLSLDFEAGEYNVTITAVNSEGEDTYTDSFEIKEYTLTIPTFEVGTTDDIVLEYYNLDCDKKNCPSQNLRVTFTIEEIDGVLEEEIHQVIPYLESKNYTLSWTPKIPGKHPLKITIKDNKKVLEEINTYAEANACTMQNTINNVRMMIK